MSGRGAALVLGALAGVTNAAALDWPHSGPVVSGGDALVLTTEAELSVHANF